MQAWLHIESIRTTVGMLRDGLEDGSDALSSKEIKTFR